ncbi:hypothetical protein KSD_65630 [Ktedonobacter sp. SOSP1-85]|nr:hypothetical protein [Ktedonobacter sp. SOSP1-85]GHO78792.1 hypothetical protein KSD_65630 [Ktedonobacter sp. SOSP1-85]
MGLQDVQDLRPEARFTPTLIATRHSGPGSKAFGQLTPGRASAHDPQHALYHQTMISGWSACGRLLPAQKRTKLLPLGIRESWQIGQSDRLGKQGRSQRRLTRAALYMVRSGFGLMSPTEA